MPNKQKDDLFQLIHSLEKGEKRNFKLYIQRNTGNGELKAIQLFDALEKMDEYDEAVLLKKSKSISKIQLSNIKANLYKQILASLRLIKECDNVDMQLHDQLDQAKLLYNKGLYLQSLKLLDKAKQLARQFHQLAYLQQVIFFEKKIEALHITRSMQHRAEMLSEESLKVAVQMEHVSKLSNLSLQLYSWYISHGNARNKMDIASIEQLFKALMPALPSSEKMGFYEKLFLYQSYCWLTFIRHDYLGYYRYTQKWVNLFEQEPAMLQVESVHYIKGMHNLLGAHYDLKNFIKFDDTLRVFEKYYDDLNVSENANERIQTFVYLYISKIHKHYLEGTFTKGLVLVPEIMEKLDEYRLYLDRHRILVFYYKIACLYFGSGDNEKTIEYLSKIINWKVDLRSDLQCYARLLHLIAHFELGNHDLLAYLIKSVYRFMSKMENLSEVEEAMFQFMRASFHLSARNVKPKLQLLLDKIKKYENKSSEARAFAYLDVVSWIESKLENVLIEKVIRRKYLEAKRVEK
jgi:hypothetical protein